MLFQTEKVRADEFKAGDKVYFANIVEVIEVKPHTWNDDWTTLVIVHEEQPDTKAEFSFDHGQELEKVIVHEG
jgi:hypothetical protein